VIDLPVSSSTHCMIIGHRKDLLLQKGRPKTSFWIQLWLQSKPFSAV
jgi:hypothetical protein